MKMVNGYSKIGKYRLNMEYWKESAAKRRVERKTEQENTKHSKSAVKKPWLVQYRFIDPDNASTIAKYLLNGKIPRKWLAYGRYAKESDAEKALEHLDEYYRLGSKVEYRIAKRQGKKVIPNK